MSEETQKPRYEHRDISLSVVKRSAIVLLISAALIHLGVWWLYRYLRSEDQRRDVRRSLVEPVSPIPPEPRLQVDPRAEFQKYMREQQQILNSYGWVSRSEGRVHIPIDRAMQLVVEGQKR
jgi:hypothetical protein